MAIQTKDLAVSFTVGRETVRALDGISLNVECGQVFGFLGPNGAGKTTTMHILLGFTEATSGEAYIFDKDVRESIARQRIGYMPEHPDTYRFLTGREYLTMTGRLFLMKGKQLRDRVSEVLEQMGIAYAADRRIGTYSRGMMQRITFGQALINDPDLMILDEPTGGLDPIGRLDIRNIIADLKKRGKTVFFSSHELSEVELVCDHLAILSKGRIAIQGRADELVKKEGDLRELFMNIITKDEQKRNVKD